MRLKIVTGVKSFSKPEQPQPKKSKFLSAENSDHVMKLRISAKELVFQIEQWQEKELDNPKRDAWEDNSRKFAEFYDLFIRLYFNLPPR